jgi:hypothetical protein
LRKTKGQKIMADSVSTKEIYESLNKAQEARAGRIENPLLREAMGVFNRKGLFSECHEILSGKILGEVARALTGLGVDVRFQDSVEVLAMTPGGNVIEIRRDGDRYIGLNRNANNSKIYWEGEVEGLNQLESIVKLSR